jgi:predicted nucleic acid-binding protein
MTLSEELSLLGSIFIDTAPIIYYIEAHAEFGPLAKEIVNAFQSGKLIAYSSVITLAEVLPKPTERGDERLTRKFAEFLKHGRNFSMIEISERIAEAAGKLRGHYPFLKTVDAIQLAAALDLESEAFITNDGRLDKFKALKVLVLKDYL